MNSFLKNVCLTGVLLLASAPQCHGQASGNAGSYSSKGENSPADNERAKRRPTPTERRPQNKSTFIEASVLQNVKATEYVAVFGVTREGTTIGAASALMETTLRDFIRDVRALEIPESFIDVDFVAQTPIYGYVFEGDVAKEQRVGFEIKKNVSIRFRDKTLIDRLPLVAARNEIFDLIKVDYIVPNAGLIAAQLNAQAAQIIREKATRQQAQLGIALEGPTQIVADKPSIYYPVQQYDAYIASESETVRATYDRNKYTVQSARKSRTFYFNPLGPDGFDRVINPVPTDPVLLEPVVQFTAYLKVRYEPVKKPTP